MADDPRAQIDANVALQLVVGLIAELKINGTLAPRAINQMFDSALAGAEGAPRSEISEGMRRRLELLSAQLATLIVSPTDDQSPPASNPESQS